VRVSSAHVARLTTLEKARGFSSNIRINKQLPQSEGKEGKGTAPIQPVLQPAPANRWGVWITGFGDFVNVDSDFNAKGYNFTTGGFTLGLDFRLLDNLSVGVMGSYAHTWTNLQPAGNIDVDSGRGGLYATWWDHGFYVNAVIYGGHNNFESNRAGLGGVATGSTTGAEFSTFIGAGYDLHLGDLTIGPTGSLQYTNVHVDNFDERGSLAPLNIHADSEESLRSDIGFGATYAWGLGKVIVAPSLKAVWEHEFKYSALPVTASFVGIPTSFATFFGPAEGHDSAVLSAGVLVQCTPTIATYVNYDGQLGRSRYDANAVTGGVRISF
jgi:outer membrane autotransporter protein